MKKLIIALVVLGVVIAVIAMGIGLIKSLFAGAVNLLLGAIVVIALILIVVWMFAYAAKMSRK